MNVSKLAFIGSRGHYSQVLHQLSDIPSLRLTALADGGDTVAPIAAWCRENGHAPRLFDDWRVMLDKAAPDMVVVCGPFELHATMCVEAIERGIHVLTEKPAALTFSDLDRLRDACRLHPEVHLAGMMFSRFSAGFLTAKRLIVGGAIGDPRIMDARKSYKLGHRDAHYHHRETYGGTIPWIGSHAIDWVMWLMDQPIQSVYATHTSAQNNANGTMERSAQCLFQLAGQRSASVSIDVFRPGNAPTHGDDWARIVGTEGVMEVRPESITLINATNDGSIPVSVNTDRHLLRDFVDHISTGRGALIDARSTIALTEACLKARQSADEGRVIVFEDD